VQDQHLVSDLVAEAGDLRQALTPVERGERELTLESVADGAEGLVEPYRTVVRLRYWHDCSPREIARRLERPTGAVRSQLRGGLERLRARLDVVYGGDRSAWCLALAAPMNRRRPRRWLGALVAMAAAGAGVALALLAASAGD
jgi:hypothetical protein